jgi:hypothetical protein
LYDDGRGIMYIIYAIFRIQQSVLHKLCIYFRHFADY